MNLAKSPKRAGGGTLYQVTIWTTLTPYQDFYPGTLSAILPIVLELESVIAFLLATTKNCEILNYDTMLRW